MKSSYRGAIYILGAALLWSTGGLFIKKIEAEPLVIATLRAGIAGLGLLPFAKFEKISLNRYLIGYIVTSTWLVAAFVSATKLTAAANAIALQNTAPLFLFIYSLLKREIKPGIKKTIPMFFIFLGICAFLLEPNKGSTLTGNIIAISSGAAFASMTYFLRLLASGGVALVSISNLATAFLLTPFIIQAEKVPEISLMGWAALTYLGVFQIGLAYVFYARGMKETEPIKASILALSEAVLNPVWVMLFIGEVPTGYGLVGIVLILGAVVINTGLNTEAKRDSAGYIQEPSTKAD